MAPLSKADRFKRSIDTWVQSSATGESISRSLLRLQLPFPFNRQQWNNRFYLATEILIEIFSRRSGRELKVRSTLLSDPRCGSPAIIPIVRSTLTLAELPPRPASRHLLSEIEDQVHGTIVSARQPPLETSVATAKSNSAACWVPRRSAPCPGN